MDRHSNNSPGKGVAGPWKIIVPVVLIAAASLQPVAAQSTLRIVPTDSHVDVAQSDRIAPEAPAQPSQKTTVIRIVSPPGEASAIHTPFPVQQPHSSRLENQDLFGRLFVSALGSAQRQNVPTARPMAQVVTPVPLAEPMQKLVPATDAPVAFAPVQGAPVYETSPWEHVERPDLFTPLFTVASDNVPAPVRSTEKGVNASPAPDAVVESGPLAPDATNAVKVETSTAQIQQSTAVRAKDNFLALPPAISQPIAANPTTPLMSVQQPIGILEDAPSTLEPQLGASQWTTKATPELARQVRQPVGIVTDVPVISVPQVAVSQPVAKAVAAPQVAAAEQSRVATQLPITPEPKQVASVPAVTVPVAQPTIEERPAIVAVPKQVTSTPQQHASIPQPTAIASNTSPLVTGATTNITSSPERQLNDFRFVAVHDDTYRSVSRYAGLQQPNAAADPVATFMLPPAETFAYADATPPVTSPESTSPAAQHDGTGMPHSSVTSPEQLAEPQLIANDGSTANMLNGPIAGCNCNNGQLNGCPYLPGQSGAPFVCGVDCGQCGAPCCSTWRDSHCIPWSLFGPGEYVGPARPEHVSTYYLRVNDIITLTYINSRRKEAERYRIGCGDRLKLEWLRGASDTDVVLDREVLVQPDGSISLPLVGEVTAAGKTVKDLQDELVKLYGQFQRDPNITVTPLEVNLAIQDIINAVTSVSGSNGQTQALRVTPEGTIQASGLGSVYVQGLTLDELRSEIEARYAATFGPGLLVSPSLTERATTYVFVGGEVKTPARYVLEGPTTVMQAITMAGGWNVGGNLHQVVVFRRDENWCLKATKIDIRAPLYGNDPCPANDVWLRDNDQVIVPKSKILCATDVIQLYFTRGIYAAFPINYVYDFSASTGITPIP